MEFGILGPLEVIDGDQPVPIQSAKHRILLAALLLRVGELVTVNGLAEAMWGDGLPADPRRVVQTYVTRLRKVLGGTELIQSRPDGYALAVGPGDVDVCRFELLMEQARDAAGAEDRHAEAKALRQALALWRGEPLADVPSELLHRDTVTRLTEQRLDALHRRIEADLALGRHAELVAELRVLTEQHLLREPFWVQLMTALYRCGRQADALEAYQQVRRLLADELGVDPGVELRGLHQAILTNDPALWPSRVGSIPVPLPVWPDSWTAWAKPSQLPMDLADFVGRDDLVQQIQHLLADELRVPIVALSGTPGVGKTALAVHAAHGLTERFPDGQLYVNLQGATAGLQPLQPLEVLGRFLRSLSMAPGAVPTNLEEASAAFRSWVAGRRLLVVLDNAANAAQVAPLLPASLGCGVVVTSRRDLISLDGAAHLRPDVLEADEAVELLGRLASPDRVAAEPEAAAEVARCCGYLPLALRIAGARLAARPSWPVVALAERLGDTRRRLDELEVAEAGVRASFAESWHQLDASDDPVDQAAARAFGLLGVPDGPEVGVPVAARLLDVLEETAERALERLVDAHLLENPAPGRYRLHDLLRLYARELATQHHGERGQAAALRRAIGFYVATAWQTLAVLRPGDYRLARTDDRWRTGGLEFTDQQAALGWLEVERANLAAAVRQAVATPGVPAELGMQLAQALFGFYWVRSHNGDWVQANKIALGVARRAGDLAAQAQTHNDLGAGYYRQGRYDRALAHLHESLTIRRELDDATGQALSLGNLGRLYQCLGRYEGALACLQESLAICQELDDRRGQASSLGNLGELYRRLGRYEEALAYLKESLAIRTNMADRHGQAHSLGNLGIVNERLGRYEEAMACLRESLTIFRGLGDSWSEAESLRELGVTLRALGRSGEARAHWLEALAIFERLQTTDAAAQICTLLAELPRPTSPATQSL